MKSIEGDRRRFLASLLVGSALGSMSVLRGAAAKDVTWLDEVQRPSQPLPAGAPTLSPLLVDEQGQKITTLAAWEARRSQLRRWWLEFLGPMPVSRDKPPKVEVLEEDRPEGVIRQKVRYEVEPGVMVEAYLLRPAKCEGRLPGVVTLHPTTDETIRQEAGIAGVQEKYFGLMLAQQGCVTLCPRNYLWPTPQSKIATREAVEKHHAKHPRAKGMAKMLFDAQVALDILAGRPEVDSKRLGVVGHSLGAKEALYLAAFDQRIRVAVSSEGGIGVKFSNWDAPWYLGPDVRSPTFQHDHHELLALVAPRAFLLLGGDSTNGADGDRSWPFLDAVQPIYRLYSNPMPLGLYNHHQGHSVPPEAKTRIGQWFAAYL